MFKLKNGTKQEMMNVANYNNVDDVPSYVKFAIYECLMSFLELNFIFLKIKDSVKVKKMKKLSTIWEDPYM